jgi:hypothetical protein
VSVSFITKLQELVGAADADAALRNDIDEQAESLLEQFREWPVNTQIPLAYVATIVAAMIIEPNTNIRRVKATDALQLRSELG